MNDRKLTIFRRRNIGFIFQAFNLIPELTVEQNIVFPVLLDYQKPDRKYLEELLSVLNLKDAHESRTLKKPLHIQHTTVLNAKHNTQTIKGNRQGQAGSLVV